MAVFYLAGVRAVFAETGTDFDVLLNGAEVTAQNASETRESKATRGKIKKVGQAEVNSLKIRGSGLHPNFENNVTQAEPVVNSMSGDDAACMEAVTYDDGNVIPLSKRFNEDNEDIRYSVDDALLVDGDPDYADTLSKVREDARRYSAAKLEERIINFECHINGYEETASCI